ncbi:MAG: 50S ribosomal protein L29 [Leptospiraceae bacterium]|nr:50S ribosomal protein L29 [Leptospiraceae bacterium]
MKAKLSDLQSNEIQSQLNESLKLIREERFQYSVARSLENPRKIRNLRKKVAQLKTLLRAREIASAKGNK